MANDFGPWADAPDPRRNKPGVSWYEFLVVGQWFREKLVNGTDPNVGLVELRTRVRAMESRMAHWEEWDAARREAPSFVDGEHIAQRTETWDRNWAQGPGINQQLLVVGGGPPIATATTATASTTTASAAPHDPPTRVRYTTTDTLDPLTAIAAALTKVRSSMAAPPGLGDPGMSWYDFLEVGQSLRLLAIREGQDLRYWDSWGDGVEYWAETRIGNADGNAAREPLVSVDRNLRKTWTRARRWQRRLGHRRGQADGPNNADVHAENDAESSGDEDSEPMSDEDSIFGEHDRQMAELQHDLETMTAEEWEEKMERLALAEAEEGT